MASDDEFLFDRLDREVNEAKGKEKDSEKGKDRDHEKDKKRDREREKEKEKEKDRDRDKDRDRERERRSSRDRRSRDRRSRDRRSRGREKSRSRDRRSRDRDRRDRDRSRSARDDRRPKERRDDRRAMSLADELRQDRGEKPLTEQKPRRKSKWDDDGAPGVPDWLKDQFEKPKPPPEPRLGAGQRNVKVPQGCVGKILGKMGMTINEIQAATRCDVKMNQDTKDYGYSYAVVTSVQGKDEDLDLCEKMIKDKIAETGIVSSPGVPGPNPVLAKLGAAPGGLQPNLLQTLLTAAQGIVNSGTAPSPLLGLLGAAAAAAPKPALQLPPGLPAPAASAGAAAPGRAGPPVPPVAGAVPSAASGPLLRLGPPVTPVAGVGGGGMLQPPGGMVRGVGTLQPKLGLPVGMAPGVGTLQAGLPQPKVGLPVSVPPGVGALQPRLGPPVSAAPPQLLPRHAPPGLGATPPAGIGSSAAPAGPGLAGLTLPASIGGSATSGGPCFGSLTLPASMTNPAAPKLVLPAVHGSSIVPKMSCVFASDWGSGVDGLAPVPPAPPGVQGAMPKGAVPKLVPPFIVPPLRPTGNPSGPYC